MAERAGGLIALRVESAVLFKKTFHCICDGFWSRCDFASTIPDEQKSISLLLTRHDLCDDHGSSSRHGFLHSRSASLADEDM